MKLTLFSFLILASIVSCTTKPDRKENKTVSKIQPAKNVVKSPQDQSTEIIQIFTDSLNIAEKGISKIVIIKHRVLDKNYVIVKFYTKGPAYWYIQNTYTYECDALMDLQPSISDFNNDKLNDITFVSGTAGRGANEVRRLFVYDKHEKKLISILNSQDFPNMQYNAELNCIDAWAFHGGTTTIFARIEADSLKEFASVNRDENITVYEINKYGKKRLIKQDTILSFKDRDVFVRYKNYRPLKEY